MEIYPSGKMLKSRGYIIIYMGKFIHSLTHSCFLSLCHEPGIGVHQRTRPHWPIRLSVCSQGSKLENQLFIKVVRPTIKTCMEEEEMLPILKVALLMVIWLSFSDWQNLRSFSSLYWVFTRFSSLSSLMIKFKDFQNLFDSSFSWLWAPSM